MTTEETLVSTALQSWKLVIGRADRAFQAMNDEQLQREIAPGKNRLLYLLGHLTAVHDRMLPMLGLGERLHPELDATYIDQPDRAVPDPVPASALKKAWTDVNATLTSAFEALTPAQWLERHNAVSEQDFAADPLRNRFAVLINRTGHAAFHSGQAILVSKQ